MDPPGPRPRVGRSDRQTCTPARSAPPPGDDGCARGRRPDEDVMTDLLAFVRRHDPDRFLSALFAPAERRGALLALYAFNHELARAREAVREPPLALIRLQWWREVVEGAARTHEVATPLSEALAAGALARDDLLALIDAREIEVEPQIDTVSDWLAYLRGTAGGLAVTAARCLGASAPESIRSLGTAYGIAGMLRAAPA